MPTYEYRCNACQREFEYQQRMSDDDLVTCEVCGEDKLEKLISWTAFGSGSASTKALYSDNPAAAIKLDKGKPPKKEPKPDPKPAPVAEAATPAATDTPVASAATDDEEDEEDDADNEAST